MDKIVRALKKKIVRACIVNDYDNSYIYSVENTSGEWNMQSTWTTYNTLIMGMGLKITQKNL